MALYLRKFREVLLIVALQVENSDKDHKGFPLGGSGAVHQAIELASLSPHEKARLANTGAPMAEIAADPTALVHGTCRPRNCRNLQLNMSLQHCLSAAWTLASSTSSSKRLLQKIGCAKLSWLQAEGPGVLPWYPVKVEVNQCYRFGCR